MTAQPKLVPFGSQTVGPYFAIGLTYLIERTPSAEAETANRIEIRGRVFDGEGAPVPDAMLEFWSADASDDDLPEPSNESGFPARFRRIMTDAEGAYSVSVVRPAPVLPGDGRTHAPHLLVLVFARGLSRHLISQVYFEDEPANASDPLLNEIAADRRRTLVAHRDTVESSVFHWDVILQGNNETVFFAW